MAKDEKKKVVGKKGLPLFDKETTEKIIKEAMASESMAEVARKWGTTEHNVYRWVRLYKRKHGIQIPNDTGSSGPRVAGGQYRQAAGDVQERLKELEEENRRLYETLGRLTLERELKKN